MKQQLYVVGVSDRAFLPLHERRAVQSALREIVRLEGSQVAASTKLGISQQAVGKGANRADVGPMVARKVEEYFKTDTAGLAQRFGAEQPLILAEQTAPYRQPADPPELAESIAKSSYLPSTIAQARLRLESLGTQLTADQWADYLDRLDCENRRIERATPTAVKPAAPPARRPPSELTRARMAHEAEKIVEATYRDLGKPLPRKKKPPPKKVAR